MHQGGGARGASHTQRPRRTETRRPRPRRVWFGRMAGFLHSGFNADERRGFGVGRGDSLGELCCRESQGEVGCREGGRAAHARCRVVQQGRRMGVGHGGCWSPVFEWRGRQGLCGPPEGAGPGGACGRAREPLGAGVAGGDPCPVRAPRASAFASRVSRFLARPGSPVFVPLHAPLPRLLLTPTQAVQDGGRRQTAAALETWPPSAAGPPGSRRQRD